ncbi:hypothetical protein [Halobacillus karajensis]|nr:hypothetical protein [Halobacillus karajensis]CDQ21809.1 hypothetical protein BN982_04239 [Halobacillus karajensis]CDQ28933.1 hypothetical protein BN981_03251 [Halobacillus karajensis]
MLKNREKYLQDKKLSNGFEANYVSELVTYSKIIDGCDRQVK